MTLGDAIVDSQYPNVTVSYVSIELVQLCSELVQSYVSKVLFWNVSSLQSQHQGSQNENLTLS